MLVVCYIGCACVDHFSELWFTITVMLSNTVLLSTASHGILVQA